MPQREAYRNTLQAAVSIAGGELNLSVRLNVPIETLRAWLKDVEPVPTAAYLRAVDLISEAKFPK